MPQGCGEGVEWCKTGLGFSVCADRVYTGSGEYRGSCVAVEKGVVRKITSRPLNRPVLDYRGTESILVPGVIDLHVHLRGLRLSYKEDEETGTRAALHGGVVAVADMPNTVPQLRSRRAVREKLEALGEKSLVDYGVYAGIPPDRRELEGILEEPILGFKVYPEDYYSPMLCTTMREASRRDLLVIVHPEDPESLGLETGWARQFSRPCSAEIAAVNYMAGMWRRCGKPRLHFTHVSCPSTVEKIIRVMGPYASLDSTPHHLLEHHVLSKNILDTCLGKVNPPLRGPLESRRLFHRVLDALLQGYPVAVASDHAPHAGEEKRLHPLLCPPGISGLDYWPGALLQSLLSAGLGARYFWLLVSRNPSLILGLSGIGRLAEGVAASFTVFSGAGRGGVEWLSRSPPYYYYMAPLVETTLVAVRGVVAFTADQGVLVEPGFGVNLVKAFKQYSRT